jgi:hypothetical protein
MHVTAGSVGHLLTLCRLNRAFDYQDVASHAGAIGREMLLRVGQAGPDGSPLARKALD